MRLDELIKALQHRLDQCPNALDYLFVPKDWMRQAISHLEEKREMEEDLELTPRCDCGGIPFHAKHCPMYEGNQ